MNIYKRISSLKATIRSKQNKMAILEESVRKIHRQHLADFLNGSLPKQVKADIDKIESVVWDISAEVTALNTELEEAISIKNGSVVTPKAIRGTGVVMSREGKLCRI